MRDFVAGKDEWRINRRWALNPGTGLERDAIVRLSTWNASHARVDTVAAQGREHTRSECLKACKEVANFKDTERIDRKPADAHGAPPAPPAASSARSIFR